MRGLVVIDTQLQKLRELIDRMRYVAERDDVLAEHTNTFREYVSVAIDALKELYEFYKGKFGQTVGIVEDLIAVAENRLKFLPEVKFGDVVATRDHNIIIDCLKPIEMALIELDKSIFFGPLESLFERYRSIYRETV